MTTTIEALAAPVRLDAYRDAMLRGDATLNDLLNYLRELSIASVADLAPNIADRDVQRSAALGAVMGALQATAVHMTSRFEADVRSAPADGLAEVVRDAAVSCRNATCDVKVLPWTEACCGYCSDECERNDSDARGRL